MATTTRPITIECGKAMTADDIREIVDEYGDNDDVMYDIQVYVREGTEFVPSEVVS